MNTTTPAADGCPMEPINYEHPVLTHQQMLQAINLTWETSNHWGRRGALRVRSGHGKPRLYSVIEILYLAHLKALTEAGVGLDQARFLAAHVFPESRALAPAEVAAVLSAAGAPEAAPRLIAIVRDGRQYLMTASDAEDVVAPVPQGRDWSIVVDVTGLILRTLSRIRVIRGASQS